MAHNDTDTDTKLRASTVWKVAAILVLIVACGLSWGAMGYALQALEDVWQDRVEALAELHGTTAPIYRVLPGLSEIGQQVAMDSAAVSLAAARLQSNTAWRTYLATTLTEAEVALMNRTTAPVAALHQAADSLVRILKGADHDQYVRHMNEVFLPGLGVVAARMEALVSLQQTVTRDRVDEARKRYKVARALLGLSILLALALAAVAYRTDPGVMRRKG
jgi:Tar ligand binding domain homologue